MLQTLSADGDLQGMFNDDAFSKIKKGARIINVARGGVIDDAALARALDSKQVAQVCFHSTCSFHKVIGTAPEVDKAFMLCCDIS